MISERIFWQIIYSSTSPRSGEGEGRRNGLWEPPFSCSACKRQRQARVEGQTRIPEDKGRTRSLQSATKAVQ